jgi:hypothetical protein
MIIKLPLSLFTVENLRYHVYDIILFRLSRYFYDDALSRQRGITNLTKQKTKVIATRVTERYARALEEYACKDAYINCADLLRDALREKLQRDAPGLCKTILEG